MIEGTLVMKLEKINQIVEEILADKNPIVPFEATYDVRKVLDERGLFTVTTDERISMSILTGRRVTKSSATTINQSIRYRVDHGQGYMTQNTWDSGQVVPYVKDIKPIN